MGGRVKQAFSQTAGRPAECCEEAAAFGLGGLMPAKDVTQAAAFVQDRGWVRVGHRTEGGYAGYPPWGLLSSNI